MKIYVSGSLAYDRIMDFPGKFSDHILPDKIHILNVCFTVNGMTEKFGGTAGNIAYTLSLLDEKPHILAAIGKDYANYFEWMNKRNIRTEGIKIVLEEFTAGAYITTDLSDNQITGFNPGAMKHETEYTFEKDKPRKTIVIISPGNLKDMIHYASACKERGISYICDPGQSLTQWKKKELREWIEGSAMLISNDYEFEMIMKVTGARKKTILGMTKALVTTLGEKGSVINSEGAEIKIPAAAVSKIVDPTGAGDAYRAGLIKGIVTRKPLDVSGKMGAVAAAFAVEKYGTQEHYFTLDEFTRRYQKNFGAY